MATVDIEAIVQAAGQGTRLGRGPKAFITLAGRTLLEHAVTTMLSVASRVTVAVPSADLMRAEQLVGSSLVRVVGGGERRIDTLRCLVTAATSPWLLLHDVVHPFVSTELSQHVVAEARATGAAAAALPNVDFLYGMDGTLRAAPGDVVAIQKPVAFRRADVVRGFAAADQVVSQGPIRDLSVVELLTMAGQSIAFVPGHTMNYKLTTAQDYTLAQQLMMRG